MVSSKVFILIGVVLAGCLLSTEGLNMLCSKCYPKEEVMEKLMPVIAKCCEEADMQPDECDIYEMNTEQRKPIDVCLTMKANMTTHEQGPIHVEKMVESVENMMDFDCVQTHDDFIAMIRECDTLCKDEDQPAIAFSICMHGRATEICDCEAGREGEEAEA